MSRKPLTMSDLINAYDEAELDEGASLADCEVFLQDEDGGVIQVNAVEFLDGAIWIITEPTD